MFRKLHLSYYAEFLVPDFFHACMMILFPGDGRRTELCSGETGQVCDEQESVAKQVLLLIKDFFVLCFIRAMLCMFVSRLIVYLYVNIL